MAEIDTQLEALVGEMNVFTGDLKVDAIARIVSVLVERQSTMREHMMTMQVRMMGTVMARRSPRRRPALRPTPS